MAWKQLRLTAGRRVTAAAGERKRKKEQTATCCFYRAAAACTYSRLERAFVFQQKRAASVCCLVGCCCFIQSSALGTSLAASPPLRAVCVQPAWYQAPSGSASERMMQRKRRERERPRERAARASTSGHVSGHSNVASAAHHDIRALVLDDDVERVDHARDPFVSCVGGGSLWVCVSVAVITFRH